MSERPDCPDIRIALKGDEILCRSCREPLARFKSGKGPGFRLAILPAGQTKVWSRRGSRRAELRCRRCGVNAFDSSHGKRVKVDDGRPIELQEAPRLLIRSGDWIGWRALGGE